jgi:hypothetical protein
VHEWVVRLDGKFSIGAYVGISPEKINPVGHNAGFSCILNCYDGDVWSFGRVAGKNMGVPDRGLPVGSLISVRLDLEKRTLTFGLNGKWHDKPATTDLAPNMWYPYVQLWNSDIATTIVH